MHFTMQTTPKPANDMQLVLACIAIAALLLQ
jgi:hypothetical protein